MGNRRSAERRQTVLKPLGLYSTPNPYGQLPPGSLQDALNVVMRRPGVVSAAPAGNNYTPFTGTSIGDFVACLAPMDAGHVYSVMSRAAGWSVYEGLVGGTQNVCTLPTSIATSGLFRDSRVSATRSRDRMMFNGQRGVLVGDDMTPSNSAERALRYAGLPQPGLGVQAINFAAGSPIPNQIMVAYAAVMTREFSDGYIVKSVPSVQFKIWNPTASANDELVTLLVDWNAFSSVQTGDFVELYRTDGLLTTSLNADPGATFKMVYRYKLTAGDVATGSIVFADNQPMSAPYYQTIGKELYTNPYQEGSTGANRQPDVSGAMATFKGFTFYGNLTERPQFVLSVPGGINDTVIMVSPNKRRAAGVGGRGGAGTVTSGSATITAVSAADLVGIVPGQYYSGVNFPVNTTVSSVGATTIVMSAAATSNGTSWVTLDVLELNGNIYVFGSALALTTANKDFEITANQPVGFNTGIDVLGLELVMEPSLTSGAFPSQTLPLTITMRGTNGQNYSPPIPGITASVATISAVTTPNLLRWSKDSEPEHVPSVNETRIGSGQVIALCATKDALWIACSDGVYRLSGDAGVWRVDTIAPGLVVCSPRCMVNLRETIYAYTNYGLGAIADSGFIPISHNAVKNLLPGTPFSESAVVLMGVYGAEDEVFTQTAFNSALLIYNANTKAFTRLIDSTTHLISISAVALLENPASGPQTPLFAVNESFASTIPALVTWNSSSALLNMQVTYNPFYANEPLTNKQWIDLTYIFNSASAGVYSVLPGLALVNYPASTPLTAAQGGSQSQATVGILRAYSIAPKISPGFSVVGITTQVDFFGVSVRYVPMTWQSGARQ